MWRCIQKLEREPNWDPTESDLGERLGQWNTEHALQAKYAVAIQAVDAFGRRPVDWLKRELLVRASADDARNWFMRKVLKNEPSFLGQPYDKIRKAGSMQLIREARAFDYMNRHHLYRLVQELEKPSEAWRAVARAAVCPTSLYGTQDRIPHNFHFVRKTQVCQGAWCCPHCYARTVGDQFAKISRRIVQDGIEFVMLVSETKDIDVADEMPVSTLGMEMRGRLIEIAQKAGGVGGVWAQQIGPLMKQEDLGDAFGAGSAKSEALEYRLALLAVIPATIESVARLEQFDQKSMHHRHTGEIDVQRFQPNRSVRAMLVKGSRWSTAKALLRRNSYGLFYWPLMGVCSNEQWLARYRLLWKQPVFGTWGSWTRRGGSLHLGMLSPSPQAKETVSARRMRLMRAVEPILVQFGFPGVELPGRKRLRKMLLDSGVDISERDVRWVISRLRR